MFITGEEEDTNIQGNRKAANAERRATAQYRRIVPDTPDVQGYRTARADLAS
jgi:hypothetical protein